jgi:signal transduction histidine kinase
VLNFRHSVVFRLVLSYGALVLLTVGIASAVFYVNTSGLLLRNVDRQLNAESRRLTELHKEQGLLALQKEIDALLSDDKDIETEEFLLLDANGAKLAGNLTSWPVLDASNDNLIAEHPVARLNKPSHSRLLSRHLDDGTVLVVGRDMRDMNELARVIRTALAIGISTAFVLALIGAAVFRWHLEHQLGVIHRTTREIGAGNLRKRIAVGRGHDEFARIGRDVNRMLDDIEHLMNTARTVSNAIAHDLRTPLGRVRGALENALHFKVPEQQLRETAHSAIAEIDGIIGLFDKLLQISEAEAGLHRQSFSDFSLAHVGADIVELYEAAAEAAGMTLSFEADTDPLIHGDRDLIANLLANLLDNAIKYAGPDAQIAVHVSTHGEHARIVVQDNGQGMPAAERDRAIERFYRGDTGRSLPGNGLGLAIVAALVSLHEGTLHLEDGQPGLRVVIDLPLASASTLA